ncbi:MAG: hypothetical protein AAFU85_26820 [Planctomycetota bacterium]
MSRKEIELECELGAIRDTWSPTERTLRRRVAAEAQRRLADLVGLADFDQTSLVGTAKTEDQQVVVAA